MKAGIDKSKSWYVVRSNIKCEEKAANNLRLAGYDVYLPRFRVEKWNKRTNTYREIERPLMLRYLFLGVGNGDFDTARRCEGVEGILGDYDYHPIAVKADVIEALYLKEVDMQFDDTRAARIHRKEEAKTKKQTVAMRFPKGSSVHVLDGPFASFMAEVEHVDTRGHVQALVQIFGRMTSVTFEPPQLEPALDKKRKAA